MPLKFRLLTDEEPNTLRSWLQTLPSRRLLPLKYGGVECKVGSITSESTSLKHIGDKISWFGTSMSLEAPDAQTGANKLLFLPLNSILH